MKIRIRRAIPADFVEIHKLIKDFSVFIKLPHKVTITPEQMVKDEKHFKCLIAVYDDSIIGFATYFFTYASWSGRAIYLDDLYVSKKYRSQGIGSKLFDKVMEIGKTENCYTMKWQVSKWNDKAQEFYKSKGAIIDDTEINCDLILK